MNATLSKLIETVNNSRSLSLILVAMVLLMSGLPLLSVFSDGAHHDVELYQSVPRDMARGAVPYRDRVLEYPPYAIPVFALPFVVSDAHYLDLFKAFALSADMLIKCALLAFGLKHGTGLRSILPLTLYALAVPFMRHFFLQRYDVFPALVSVVCLLLFAQKRSFWAGVALAVGIGMKLYPAVFLPILVVFAWRRQDLKAFAAGIVAGLLPLALFSPWLPWWRFLTYHAERGLQVESLYSSILWMAHHLGLVAPKWTGGHGCMELHGPVADAVLPWAKLCFVGTVGLSVAAACLAARRLAEVTAPVLASLLLLPLLAFVAFNQVLSPQYMIWLLPVVGMASLRRGGAWWAVPISFAGMLTPQFYPVPDYMGGINFSETCFLLARNAILVGAWTLLLFDVLRLAGKQLPPNEASADPLPADVAKEKIELNG